jgi:hypothetical protein
MLTGVGIAGTFSMPVAVPVELTVPAYLENVGGPWSTETRKIGSTAGKTWLFPSVRPSGSVADVDDAR